MSKERTSPSVELAAPAPSAPGVDTATPEQDTVGNASMAAGVEGGDAGDTATLDLAASAETETETEGPAPDEKLDEEDEVAEAAGEEESKDEEADPGDDPAGDAAPGDPAGVPSDASAPDGTADGGGAPSDGAAASPAGPGAATPGPAPAGPSLGNTAGGPIPGGGGGPAGGPAPSATRGVGPAAVGPAPAVGGPGPAGPAVAGPAPGTGTDVDAWLDANVQNPVVAQTGGTTSSLIDTLNNVRAHPAGETVINITERLIPIYGAWDSVRDAWNGFAEQQELTGGDWFMSGLLGLQALVGVVGDLAAHLEYLVKIISYVCDVAGVGTAGAGTALGVLIAAGSSATIGLIPIACDGINFVLNLIGTCYASYRANKATDPQERERWRWLTYKQTEGMFVSIASGVAGLVTLGLSGGQAPVSVGRELARNAITGVAGSVVKGAAKLLIGTAAPERTPAPAPGDAMPRLPKDIIGDIAAVSTWPALPFMTPEQRAARDRIVYGTAAPAAPAPSANTPNTTSSVSAAHAAHAAAAAQQPPQGPVGPVDHAPSQVGALGQLEAALTLERATAAENVASSTERIANAGQMSASIGQAKEATEARREGVGGLGGDLASAATTGEGLVANTSGLVQGLAQGASPMSQLAGVIGTASQAGGANPSPPPAESWWDQAKQWMMERAFGMLTGAVGGVAGGAAAAGAQQGEGQGFLGRAGGEFGAAAAAEQASLGQTRAATAEAQTGEARAAADAAALAGEQGRVDAWGAEGQTELAEHRAEQADLEAQLSVVTAERERQESANAAFAAQWSSWFGQTPSEYGPLSQALVDGLGVAIEDLRGLSAACVAEGRGQLGVLSADARARAEEILTSFQASEDGRIAGVLGQVSGLGAFVGASTPEAWAAVERAEAALIGAEASIRGDFEAVRDTIAQIVTATAATEAEVGPVADSAPEAPGDAPEEAPAEEIEVAPPPPPAPSAGAPT